MPSALFFGARSSRLLARVPLDLAWMLVGGLIVSLSWRATVLVCGAEALIGGNTPTSSPFCVYLSNIDGCYTGHHP